MPTPRIRLLVMTLFLLLSLALLGACGTYNSPGNGTPAATSQGGY